MSGDNKKERVIMKKTLAVLMALAMAASMAGCGAGSQPASGDTGAKTEAASSDQEKSGIPQKPEESIGLVLPMLPYQTAGV